MRNKTEVGVDHMRVG